MEGCISSMSYLDEISTVSAFRHFQDFRVGRDGMPWASAPEDRTAPNDGITKHPNPPWPWHQAGAVSPTGFRPAPPGVSRGRRLIHTPGTPWRCQPQQTEQRAAQSATNLHSSSDVLAMAPVACQPHALEHAWTTAGSWAIGNNQQPCMPEGQNGGLLKTNVDAQVLDRSDQKIATTNPTHSSTRCSSWGCIVLSSTLRTGWWGVARLRAWIGEQDPRHIAGRLLVQQAEGLLSMAERVRRLKTAPHL